MNMQDVILLLSLYKIALTIHLALERQDRGQDEKMFASYVKEKQQKGDPSL
jgi:hypothetical protein